MKKIFILLVLLAILLLNGITSKTEFSLSNYFKTGIITKYTNENCNNSILPNITINGNNTIIGESIYFDSLNLTNALSSLNANIQFVEYIKEIDLTILYCYSPLVPREVLIKKKYINLQIATTTSYTVIGWPLILGSF